MKLAKALTQLAPFALDKERKGTGVIYVTPSHAYARQGGARLVIRCSDAPGSSFALLAESVKATKGPLAAMDGRVEVRQKDRRTTSLVEWRGQPEQPVNAIDLLLADPHDPEARPFAAPTWIVEVTEIDWNAAQAVAACAASPKDDRPAFEIVQLGPTWADATDEIIVARAPFPIGRQIRVPAALLEYVSPEGGYGSISESADGVTLASAQDPQVAEVRVIIDDVRSRSGFFPDCDAVWSVVDQLVPGVKVQTAKVKKAVSHVKAAVAKSAQVDGAGAAVRFQTTPQVVVVAGGPAFQTVELEPPPKPKKGEPEPPPLNPRVGSTYLTAEAFTTAIGGIGKVIEVVVFGDGGAVEIRGGYARRLISPVRQVAAHPSTRDAAPGQR